MNKKILIFLGLVIILGSTFYFLKIKSLPKETTLLSDTQLYGGCNEIKNDDNKIRQCWDNLVRDTAQNKGIAYAMQILTELSNNPLFAKECHSYTHTIGGEAYLEFKKSNNINISPAMNYCGFGFYHGFMEMLFAKGGNIQIARDLCSYMDKQISNPAKYEYGACFHGIGHGVVDGSNKKDWGNAQALIAPGLKLCDEVAVTDEEHYRCYSGAFNSISIAYVSNQYGLNVDKKDPLKFCKQQKEQYRRACYADVAVIIMHETSDDLAKAIKLIESIPEDEYAIEAIKNSAGLKARVFTGNLKDIITTCKSTQDRLRMACIKGFGSGLVEFGPANKEHTRAFEFCGSSLLNDEEKTICFKDVFSLLGSSRNREKLNTLCSDLEKKYRHLCQI